MAWQHHPIIIYTQFVLRFWTIICSVVALSGPALAQNYEAKVFADQKGKVHITLADGHRYVIRGEKAQVGIDQVRTAPDGKTIGWLVDYSNTGEPAPEAGTLVIVRSGHVIRRFETNQIFWAWSFYDQGKQVTYHSGPNHGDFAEHSELHDIESGHLVAQWDHDPSDANDAKMPSWAAALDRK